MPVERAPKDAGSQRPTESPLSVARRLARAGDPARAFGELARAARAGPLTPVLASALVRLAAKSGTEAVAITLLEGAVEAIPLHSRAGVRRQLARLLRRVGELERSREALVVLLAEFPADRRARRVLNALLEREGRWDELDASLEKEARESLQRSLFRRAARATLRRARVWEQLGNQARAALRYGQAAQHAERGNDAESAFHLRMLWVRALHESAAPARARSEAAAALLEAGQRVGREGRARALLDELTAAGQSKPGTPRRRQTHRELVAAAADASAHGKRSESAALLSAALRESYDERTFRKLETQLVAAGAWGDLAALYRTRADGASSEAERVDALSKLAELLEDELSDPGTAARVYGEIVTVSGDRQALGEQVRLLSAQKDGAGVRGALDAAVEKASNERGRLAGLLARGEHALARGELALAAADFQLALKLEPGSVEALAGAAEAGFAQGDRSLLGPFSQALARVTRRSPRRGALYRRLARLAARAADGPMARAAWAEVLVELPEDEEAQEQLSELAKAAGDQAQLETVLRAYLKRDSRGLKARAARLELVGLLERALRLDEALVELRQAVRYEPGHKEAWLLLAERLMQRGEPDQSVWALENAATAMDDEAERLQTWNRLAAFCRDVLGDQSRAAVFTARADSIRQARASRAPVGKHEPETDPSHSLVEAPSPSLQLASTQPLSAPVEVDPALFAEAEALLAGPTVPLEAAGVSSRAGEEDTAPSAVALPSRKEQTDTEAQGRLLAQLRDHPLEAASYRDLADHFGAAGEEARSVILLEIARALDGEGLDAAPAAPKLACTAADRAGLRHSMFRTPLGELLEACADGLGRLFPPKGRAARSPRLDAKMGPGAAAAIEALGSAARILGLQAPEVLLSKDNGPPFSAESTAEGPRLLVGQLALRKTLPAAELRFFAGRALFTTEAGLLVARSLTREQLQRGLLALGQLLRGGRMTATVRTLRDAVPRGEVPRLRGLFNAVGERPDLRAVIDGARHSANRAGLITCGAVAPALACLRAKRAPLSEQTELLRFAASDRYLGLRHPGALR